MEAKANALSPFIETKVRTWYRLHNKKRNGFMHREDYTDMAESFIKEFKLDGEMAEEVRSWLVDGWSALIKYMKSIGDDGKPILNAEQIPTMLQVADKLSKDGTITEDMFVTGFGESLKIHPSPFPVCFSQMVSVFFKVFDTDKDGYITEKDLIRAWKCFGITNTKAVKAVFADLDASKSGKIDQDTYVGAWMEYMTGNDHDAPMAKYMKPDML